jgi:hypothetical protein
MKGKLLRLVFLLRRKMTAQFKHFYSEDLQNVGKPSYQPFCFGYCKRFSEKLVDAVSAQFWYICLLGLLTSVTGGS